jgi:hypothetical protein
MIWMSQDGEPRKNDADRENHHEPDPPHGHLGGMAGGSLAERQHAHQRPGLDEHRGAGPARATE